MVWYWELTQGHGKAQINTTKLCKVFLALVHSKLKVACILTADFYTCVSACSWSILVDVSILLLLLTQTIFMKVGKKAPPQLHLTSLFGLSGGNAAP